MTRTSRFIIIANPNCRRTEHFAAALQGYGYAPPIFVEWESLLTGTARLRDILRPGDCVRIESPGRHWAVEKALLNLGADAAEREGGFGFLSRQQVALLEFDKGRIWPSRQWYHGFAAGLRQIKTELEACPGHQSMQAPDEILTMFDKSMCHQLLEARNVPVPKVAAPEPGWFPTCLDHLLARLTELNWSRVFLKPAHGSSGVGVAALEFQGDKVNATTTVEMELHGSGTRLYATRQLQTYRTWKEVRHLVDLLCRERLHVELWWPKASFRGLPSDLRAVTVGGRAWGGILRFGKGPITNLHLLNRRANLDEWVEVSGADAWDLAASAAEAAMACFPVSLSGGVDIAFSHGWSRHVVLEVNAWGDFLPGVLGRGGDCYAAQIATFAGMAPA